MTQKDSTIGDSFWITASVFVQFRGRISKSRTWALEDILSLRGGEGWGLVITARMGMNCQVEDQSF